MNKPIRTHGGRLHGALPGAAAQRDLPAVRPAPTTSTTATTTGGSCDAEFSREARRDPGRGNPVAESVPATTSSSTSGATPQPLQVRPPHRLLLLHLRRHRRGVEPEPDPLRQRPAALRQPGRRHGEQHPAGGRLGLADGRPAAQTAAVDGIQALGTDTQAAVVAPRAVDGRDPGDGVEPDLRPQPAGLPRPRAACRSNYDRLIEDARASRCSTGRSRRSIRPGRPSSWSPRRRALESGDYDADTQGRRPAASSSTCPRPTTRLPNSGGGNCGGDEITLTQALHGLLQRGLRRARARARRRRAARAGREVRLRLSATSRGSAARRSARSPATPTSRRPRYSAIGQFDVRATPLQMALVTATIANDGQGMRPYLVDEVRAPDLSVLDKTSAGGDARPGDVARRRPAR